MNQVKSFISLRRVAVKIALIFAIFMGSSSQELRAQNQDGIVRFFEKYLDDDNFTVVYITPKMFQMISKLSPNDPETQNVKEILKDLKGLRVLTCEKNGLALYREAVSKFNNADYELLMKVRDDGENVNFWTREVNGNIVELLLLVGGKEEFTLISFVGNIDLAKLSRLSDKINITGADQLKKLPKKPKQGGEPEPE